MTATMGNTVEVGAEAVRKAAYQWHEAGFAVLPVTETGEKKPDVKWTHFQVEAPTVQQIGRWYDGTGRQGVGLIMGAISGNVEMFELEGRAVAEGARERIIPALKAAGVYGVWQRLVGGYVDISPSGGPHFIYRVADREVPKNTKVASRPKKPEELTDADRELLKKYPKKVIPYVLAETRGEGGFTVVAPSHGSTHPTGRAWEISKKSHPGEVVSITWDERIALFAAIHAVLDEMPEPEPVTPRAPVQPTSDGSKRPGDDYSRQKSWADILQPHNWQLVYQRGDMDFWRRPGDDKRIGWSARTGGTYDGLWVWSTSTCFPAEESITKFKAYAYLEHGGNEREAASQLRRDGYGGQRAATPPRPVATSRVNEVPPADLGGDAGSGLADDADRFNRAISAMRRIGELMSLHSGNDPLIPNQKVLAEVFDLLHLVANPTGQVGEAVTDRYPAYPTEHLPTAMQAQLEARGSLHPAGVGAGMLGCASAAGMSSRLIISGTRRVVPTLYVPAIGYAGVAKTPAAEIAFRPFLNREEVETNKYVKGMLDWKKMTTDERKSGIKPYNDTRLISDITPEALARRLYNPTSGGLEGVAVNADELASFLLGFGGYKKGDAQSAEKGRLLALWSGRPWMYERVGSGDEGVFMPIMEPVMPIFGTIQPDFVRLLGDVGSGLQARWLPHMVGDRDGRKTGHTADLWASTVDKMLQALHSGRIWTLDEGSQAWDLLDEADARWEIERQLVEQTPASTAFLRKGNEHCVRVALVLADTEAATEAARSRNLISCGRLPAWAIQHGIALVDYCAAVWRALGTTESGLSLSYAEKAIAEKDDQLNAWLHGRKDKSATLHDITRAKVAGCRTKAEVQALVDRHRATYGEDSVVAIRANGFKVYAR